MGGHGRFARMFRVAGINDPHVRGVTVSLSSCSDEFSYFSQCKLISSGQDVLPNINVAVYKAPLLTTIGRP